MGFVVLVMDTVVCLTLAKWETVSGQFGGYLKARISMFKLMSGASWEVGSKEMEL